MIKKSLFFLILCMLHQAHITCQDEKHNNQTTETIVSDVVAMTDHIADMIITCKTEKDPQKIKSLITSIIKSLASIIEQIVEKRRLKKMHRSISINEFDFSDISSLSLEEEVEQVIRAIIKKTGVDNDN